ncbi:MAG: sugar kinase [Mycobacteriales bacterium]
MSETRQRVVAIGECMLELSAAGDGLMRVGYAGDSVNTAVYLARLATPTGDIDIAYATAIGDDAHSDAMAGWWRSEGVSDRLAQRLPGRSPGLYLIDVDAAGERFFTYYRSEAAARETFGPDYPAGFDDEIAAAALVYLTGISLSVVRAEHRPRLWATLQRGRAAGARIVFDTNYRPRGWPSPAAARVAISATVALADIALPTYDDDALLFGDTTPEACADRIHAAGVGEVVVKLGGRGALVSTVDGAVLVPAERDVAVVDTTAAGDSFNAAYLLARLRGDSPVAAAAAGHRLAARVIGVPGAIAPR